MNDAHEVKPLTPQVSNLPSWPIWAPFAAIGLAFIISAIFEIAFRIILRIVVPQMGFPHDFSMVLSLLTGLGGVLLLGFMLKGGMSAARIGLTRTSLKVSIALGALACAIEYAVLLLGPHFVEFEPQDLSHINNSGFISAYLSVAIIAPIVEEILFRGVMFSAFSRRFGLVVGIIVSSGFFGLAHFSSTGIFEMAVLSFFGVIWALLYWRTGSIIPGIVLHGFDNALVVGEVLHYGVWSIFIAVATIPILLLLTLPFAKVRFAPNWPRFLAKP